MAVSDRMTKALVKNAVNVHRVAEHIRRQCFTVEMELEDKLIRLLERADLDGAARTPTKLGRIESFLGDAERATKAAFAHFIDVLEGHLVELADHQRRTIPRLLNEQIGAPLFLGSLLKSDVTAIVRDLMVRGAPLDDWLKKFGVDLSHRMATQLRLGLAADETTKELAERVRGKRARGSIYAGGVLDRTRRDLSSLVLTAVSKIANEVAMRTYHGQGSAKV